MTNLTLITNETFYTTGCDFYKDQDNNVLLTREQIGSALEYKDPSKAIQKIHLAHKDRIEPFCIRMKLGHPQTKTQLTKSEEQERVYYTERGVMEICRWSRQKKADEFMDWAWNIIDQYRKNNLSNIDNTQANNNLDILLNRLDQLETQIKDLKHDDSIRPELDATHPSAFFLEMAPKYKILMRHFNCTRNELYSSIYRELENIYGIDLNQIKERYCEKYDLNSEDVYLMDVIEYNPWLKDGLVLLVDTYLIRHGLQSINNIKRSNKITLFSE